MNDKAILPCPFCGAAGHIDEAGAWFSVGCLSDQKCPAYLRAQVHRTKDAAISAWNRRAALQWAASQQAAEGWRPISEAPEEGVFLVYLPQERESARIQVARWRKSVKIIGSLFAFDMTAPTHWRPLPAAPTAQGERDGQ